jgi:hypothetical protein
MNELIIAGILSAILTAIIAVTAAVENKDAIAAWIDREITARYAARIAKRRVREIWQIRR